MNEWVILQYMFEEVDNLPENTKDWIAHIHAKFSNLPWEWVSDCVRVLETLWEDAGITDFPPARNTRCTWSGCVLGVFYAGGPVIICGYCVVPAIRILKQHGVMNDG